MPHTPYEKALRNIQRRPLLSNPDDLPSTLHPVLRRVYAARNIKSEGELDASFQTLLPTTQLAGLEQAINLLQQALSHAWTIVIVGDFDADGATSSALAVKALTAFGAKSVHYVVPNRFTYGYGLTPEIVAVVADYQPQLIITVDNGISSIEGVDAAHDRDIKVLVTDHHLPGDQLPRADAIVNPNQPGDGFLSKNLAGVGVIFYVLLALRARLRETDWFTRNERKEPNMAEYLDLVALGTVADVVPLDHNNRILVEQGLRRIRAGRCRPGISALIDIAKRKQTDLAASDLGFAIGPRLNAAGRLEDMSVGIECLLTENPDTARLLAQQLDELNRDRREIEGRMQMEANAAMDAINLNEGRGLPWGLCLFDKHWHQGVIGILASRIKERYNRPVIAFAPAQEDGRGSEIKGSARSISGLHIRDALDAVAAKNPGLISKFGGHAMAAGLTLDQANYKTFIAAFDEEVRLKLTEADLKGVINSDGELQGLELGLELAEQLRAAGPWGQAFPEPLFDGVFRITERRIVGQKHLKITVSPEKGGPGMDGIAFNFPVEEGLPREDALVRLVYRLDVNEFRGIRSAQLMVEELQLLSISKDV